MQPRGFTHSHTYTHTHTHTRTHTQLQLLRVCPYCVKMTESCTSNCNTAAGRRFDARQGCAAGGHRRRRRLRAGFLTCGVLKQGPDGEAAAAVCNREAAHTHSHTLCLSLSHTHILSLPLPLFISLSHTTHRDLMAKQLQLYATEGLRTLVLASKDRSQEESGRAITTNARAQ